MSKLATAILAVSAWNLCTLPALAQYRPGGFGGGAMRPTVSPYLNLAHGGDPAINYYGLVRPQIAYNKAIQNINNDINVLEANPNMPTQTGHRSSFMTQYKYFMNNGYPGGATGYNQLSFRPNTVAGSNTIAGGNQSTPIGAGYAGGSGVPGASGRVR